MNEEQANTIVYHLMFIQTVVVYMALLLTGWFVVNTSKNK